MVRSLQHPCKDSILPHADKLCASRERKCPKSRCTWPPGIAVPVHGPGSVLTGMLGRGSNADIVFTADPLDLGYPVKGQPICYSCDPSHLNGQMGKRGEPGQLLPVEDHPAVS